MSNEYKLAAAYIRVSTEDQTEISPDSQLEKIREYALKNNLSLQSEFIFRDDGISGRAASKRPGFQQMIAAAKSPSRPFDVIIVWKYSRFARNQEESIFYKSILRSKCNVDVVSVSEPLIAGPFGSLIERIIEWMDEFYSLRLSEEVKRSMTLNAKNGVLQSIPSFGYRSENRILVPIPEEAELVREIFDRFNSGDSMFNISRDFSARGIRTHRGTLFENRTVEYILRNPVYIGKLRWNPTGRTRRDFNNENIIVADGQHEPIIDIDTWKLAQNRIAEQKARWKYHARPSGDRKHWLCGIVRCAECGATLIWSNPHFMKCNNYVRGRCLATQHIAVELLEEAFLQQLQHDLSFTSGLSFQEVEIQRPSDTELGKLQKVKSRLTTRLDRAREAYIAGIDTLSEYSATKTSIETELASIEAKIESLQKITNKESTERSIRDSIRNTLATLHSDAPIAQKYDAVNSIVESCIFNKKDMTLAITYRVEV